MSAQVETMAYNKAEKPWHLFGNPVDDSLTPMEMRKAAGLDWTVSKDKLFINGDGKNYHEVKGSFALVRNTDRRILDIVGSSYRPFQNEDVMDFFTKFVKAGHMKMETAGSLRNGQFIWALAAIEKDFSVGKGDKLLSYLLMMQPHKLGRAMIFQTTAIRVVCWNTLSMALGAELGGRGNAYRVPHLSVFDDDAKLRAEEALGLATTQMTAFAEAAKVLSKKRVKDEEVRTFFQKLLTRGKAATPAEPANEDEAPKDSIRLKRMLEAYASAPGQNLPGAEGTLWGAVNAVTYVVDHVNGRTADARLSKAWFGSGARMKQRALTEALKLAA